MAPYRNPFLLAKAAATLDRLSGGRFILGVGTGYHKAEFFALGVDFDERNDLFDEMLDVLPLAWTGEPFSYHGRHFDARDVISQAGARAAVDPDLDRRQLQAHAPARRPACPGLDAVPA